MQSMENGAPEVMPTKSIDLLTKYLTSVVDLHLQVKRAHWNVRMRRFVALTDTFGRVAVEIAFIANCIDERLGGLSLFEKRSGAYCANQFIKMPYMSRISDGQQDVLNVYRALSKFGKTLPPAIGLALDFDDIKTAKLFAEISQTVDKQLWLVESQWLQNQTLSARSVQMMG